MDANQSPGTTSIALTGLTTAIFSHLICVEGIGRLYPAAS